MTVGGREALERLLPYRGEALLIDEFSETCPNGGQPGLCATYRVPLGSWWVEGHFPGNPVMPGTMQLEVAAQACALLAVLISKSTGQFALAGNDEVRFRKVVRPGDILTILVTNTRHKMSLWKFSFEITNQSGELVASGNITGVELKDEGNEG